MNAKAALRRYRTCYERLLQLYPRRFREQFGEGMAQSFHDLCREHVHASSRQLFGVALWVFFETSLGIVREGISRMSQLGKTMLRVALVALGLLMVPLVASRIVEGWHWNAGAFVIVYLLFFATGIAYAVITRKMGGWSYKAGVGLALAAGVALGWSNMVHVADSENPANLVYYGVLVMGVVGACLARLQARGLARTLFAMAVVLALIAIMLPSGAPPYMARNMGIGHTVFVVLFVASGLLFRHASLARIKQD